MNGIQKECLHKLYSRPILFVGLLLLLAGIWSYTRMQTNLFPEVLFPRVTVIADAGQQPVDRMMITNQTSGKCREEGTGSNCREEQYQ